MKVRALRLRERAKALERLAIAPRENLLLADAVRRLGSDPLPGEARPEVLGAWRGEELVALAALQPAMGVSAQADPEAIEALLPHLGATRAGLVKCAEPLAGRIWGPLAAEGRRPLLDRIETAWALAPEQAPPAEVPAAARARRAERRDLDALVAAARASLREEQRPDPFEGDPRGFRRWVASRISRALVIEWDGAVRFVGYADVQSREGWLLQGVFTDPSWRRRGLAASGVAALCARAFEAGADHVQLAVVEGNTAAENLYTKLAFEPFARLRTVLFV